MTRRKLIIGFIGRKGAGKNFTSKIVKKLFKQQGLTVVEFAFADPMKQIASIATGVPLKLFYGDNSVKDTKTHLYWKDLAPRIRRRYPYKRGRVTVREICQLFGSDIFKENWDKDVWVSKLKLRILESQADVVLVTDVRFVPEVNVLKRLGGKIWKIDDPHSRIKFDSHPSESHYKILPADEIIVNDRKSGRLKTIVKDILKQKHYMLTK